MTQVTAETIDFLASDGAVVQLYRWGAASASRAATRGVVQIAHGMGEHAGRYQALAEALVAAGYRVYANDHRGHGATAEPGLDGWMGADGWNRTITDACEIAQHIRRREADLPLVLLGHSMGSMLAQQFICRHGEQLDAAILCGTPGINGALQSWLVHTLARFERRRLGPTAHSPLLQKMIFGDANTAFAGPGATGYEWLSRDHAQVAAYVEDPRCGFVLRAGSLCDLFAGTREARRHAFIARIPGDLPVLVINGGDDPVHASGANIERMLRAYRPRIRHLESRIYHGARHELFNETNRDEVVRDVLAWLDRVLPGGG
jgi:alpha-beta hydrolase superfamily lysophospholipase